MTDDRTTGIDLPQTSSWPLSTSEEAVKTGALGAAPAMEPAPTLASAASGMADEAGDMAEDAAQTLKSKAGNLGQQAAEKARAYADQGKAQATSALDDFARMMDDAAGQVDERLGPQFGGYARSAAGAVSGFADSLRGKEVEDLLDDARGFVRKSPAVAIGTAAAIGFVIARVIKSGLDAADRTADQPMAFTADDEMDVAFTPAPDRDLV